MPRWEVSRVCKSIKTLQMPGLCGNTMIPLHDSSLSAEDKHFIVTWLKLGAGLHAHPRVRMRHTGSLGSSGLMGILVL